MTTQYSDMSDRTSQTSLASFLSLSSATYGYKMVRAAHIVQKMNSSICLVQLKAPWVENALRCPLLKPSLVSCCRGRALPVVSHWKYSFWSNNGWISSRTWTCMSPLLKRVQSLFTLVNKSCENLCLFKTYINHNLQPVKPYMCKCATKSLSEV